MPSTLLAFVKKVLVYGFGLCSFFYYHGIAISNGSFFHRETEKEMLELALARDRFWNLSKPFEGLSHCFYTLKKSGLKLHYLCNNPDRSPSYTAKPLVFLIHGFPDSCLVWRQLFRSSSILKDATVIAVDLPGYGGSDSFPDYGATEVLEALTEFVAEIRELHYTDTEQNGSVETTTSQAGKAFIVGHDWGCALAYRLAAEAPYLADRFILSNGPYARLAWENKNRIISSTSKMLATCYHNPRNSRVCLTKIFSTVKPLIRQVLLFSYMFAFQLPSFMVSYLLNGGNRAFLRGCHALSFGSDKSLFNSADCMATTLGPSTSECRTSTPLKNSPTIIKPQTYPSSVLYRARHGNAIDITALYRSRAGLGPWTKSLETLASLHNLETMYPPSPGLHARRHSSGASLFEERVQGALKAPATILWGADDMAVTMEVCLDGIGEYLAKGSEVVVLKGVGHWLPLEGAGCKALGRVVEDVVRGRRERIGERVKDVCAGAEVVAERY